MLQDLINQGRAAQRSGAFDDALEKYREALEIARASGKSAEAADVLRWTAAVHSERGELDTAAELLDESVRVAEAAALDDRLASAFNAIGTVEILKGDLLRAEHELARARVLAESTGDGALLAMIDMNLGVIANIHGDVQQALSSYDSALERYLEIRDEASASRALNNIGMAKVDLGDLPAAATAFARAAKHARAAGDVPMKARIELNTAEIHLKRQHYEAARESVEQSLAISRGLQNRASVGEAYKFYGILCRETGKPNQSDTYFALSLGLAEESQNRLLQAETQLEWGLLHLDEGRDQQQGIRRLNRSLRIFRDLSAGREVLDIERRLQKHHRHYMPAVSTWSAAFSECGSSVPAGHGDRVASYASSLASEVGIDGWDLTWIRVGAVIHDIGHITVPKSELIHVEALAEPVPGAARTHTRVGASMAAELEFPDPVWSIVRSHHERWLGDGYPDRLAGEAIPLGARVVSIADAFDTLTTATIHRRAFSREQGLSIMSGELASAFDPALLTAFQHVMRGGSAPLKES